MFLNSTSTHSVHVREHFRRAHFTEHVVSLLLPRNTHAIYYRLSIRRVRRTAVFEGHDEKVLKKYLTIDG